jgi:putative DNA primase/helicase
MSRGFRVVDLPEPAPRTDGAIPPTAEDSIALRFAERHADELRYVAVWGWWLSYDGARWTRDETLRAFDRARAICREIAAEPDRPSSTIASAKTVVAIERLAKADRKLAATTAQWDANAWLLNTGEEDDGDERDL